MTLPYVFDHVHIYCSDLTESVRWFVDVVGAEVVERRGVEASQTVVLSVGGGSILLRPRLAGEDLSAADGPRFGVDHIGFRVDDVRRVVEHLRARGAVISTEPRELRPGVFVAFIQGPDLVRIELLQRPAVASEEV